MNIKALAAAALTASTLLFAPVPEAQAKNVYCSETNSGIEFCYSRVGYESWQLIAQDRDSYDGVEAIVDCETGRVRFYSNDGFNTSKVRRAMQNWCLN